MFLTAFFITFVNGCQAFRERVLVYVVLVVEFRVWISSETLISVSATIERRLLWSERIRIVGSLKVLKIFDNCRDFLICGIVGAHWLCIVEFFNIWGALGIFEQGIFIFLWLSGSLEWVRMFNMTKGQVWVLRCLWSIECCDGQCFIEFGTASQTIMTRIRETFRPYCRLSIIFTASSCILDLVQTLHGAFVSYPVWMCDFSYRFLILQISGWWLWLFICISWCRINIQIILSIHHDLGVLFLQ